MQCIKCQNSDLLCKLHFDMTLAIETKAIVGVLSINRPCRNFLSLGANLILATMSLPIFSFTLYQQPTKSPRVEASGCHASRGGVSGSFNSEKWNGKTKINRDTCLLLVDDVFLHNVLEDRSWKTCMGAYGRFSPTAKGKPTFSGVFSAFPWLTISIKCLPCGSTEMHGPC